MRFTSFFWLFLLFFFCQTVFSQSVFVSIEPSSPGSALELYALEVSSFDLVVINNSSKPLTNFDVLLTATNEIVFFDDDREKNEQRVSFVSIAQGEEKRKTFFVKSLFFTPNQPRISAEYFVNDSLKTYSVFLTIKNNPLSFDALLEKNSVKPEEENSVIFDLVNNGNETISNVSVQAVFPQGFSFENNVFSFDNLVAGQSVLNARIYFKAPFEEAGIQPISVTAIYYDSSGRREITKNLEVNVGNNQDIFLVVGVLALLAAIGVLFLRATKKGGQSHSIPVSHLSEHDASHGSH